MSKVVILGSGASKAAWGNQGPPLLSDFFSHGFQLKGRALFENIHDCMKFYSEENHRKHGLLLSLNPERTLKERYCESIGFLQHRPWEFIKARYGILEIEKIDLEVLLSIVQADIEIEPMGETEYTLYELNAMLRRFTAEVLLLSMKKVECPLHRQLTENLVEGDAIISFNYDLIMDLSLLGQTKHLWEEHTGYGTNFERIAEKRGTGFPPTQWSDKTYTTIDSITYLKLHGSLNWLWKGEEYKEPVPTLFPVSVLRDLDWRIWWAFDRDEFPEPLIIPPVNSKVLWEPLKPLWAKARIKLQSA
jgi:hypothetical protein